KVSSSSRSRNCWRPASRSWPRPVMMRIPATPTDTISCRVISQPPPCRGSPKRMSEPAPPFSLKRYQLRPLRDGRTLRLGPFTPDTADILGAATAAIGPWAHYGFDGERLAAAFKSSGGGRLQVECGGELAGAIVVLCPWLAGPYLQLLAVLPAHQNQ